jgi:superfamily II DNA or RNA helicase
MKSTKYDTLKAVIKENLDEPMLILTESAKFARVVASKLKEDGYAAEEWSGNVSEFAREETKRRFMDSDGVDYIVATIASIGEGVDGLQARSRFMVWLSRHDSNQLNEQAFRRLYRRGQERQVISIDIAALATYDHGQLDHLVQQALDMNRSLKRKKA